MSSHAKLFMWLGIGAGILFLSVVVAAFGFVLIIMPRAREQAVRANCMANLRSLGISTSIYAAQWGGALPTPGKGYDGTWLCDQESHFSSVLPGSMAPSRNPGTQGACPANSNQMPTVLLPDNRYNFNVSGYVWTNDRSKASGAAMPVMPTAARKPPLEYHEKLSGVRDMVHTELAADWIISTTPGGGTWMGITDRAHSGVYDTSHMSGSKPAGGNVLYFDGHVEWKNFSTGNAVAVPQAGGSAFWFINP